MLSRGADVAIGFRFEDALVVTGESAPEQD